MIERDGTNCPQCGYPSFAGHGPDCPANKKADAHSSEVDALKSANAIRREALQTQVVKSGDKESEEKDKAERGEHFVDHVKYKAVGGEMSEEDYFDVQRQQGNAESASEKLWDLYLLYRDDNYSRYPAPTDAMESIFAKIDVQFPDKSDEWKFDETMFCLGVKDFDQHQEPY